MFFGSKLWSWAQWVYRKPRLFVTLVIFGLCTTLYLKSENSFNLILYQEITSKYWNESEEIPEGYLVWSRKCQIIARDPLDSSIRRFVKKEKFEPCTKTPLLTSIVEAQNGQYVLKLDQKLAKNYPGLSCSWAPVSRSKPTKTPDANIDSKVDLGAYTDLKDEVILPEDVEVMLVKCKGKNGKFKTKEGQKIVYEDVHPVIQTGKVASKIKGNKTSEGKRKLSVLLLGIDNVSRLNFERSMPKTKRHLRDIGWFELKGYNKMADNTFPNLMAILTGLTSPRAYEICKPTQPFGLDECPMIWYAFRNNSYVTAYGEDEMTISTFNYMKKGFMNPPTDFYLRPYMTAAEKFLGRKRYLGAEFYCTGPESSGIRILNYAVDFARKFIGVPYFGLFWTNSMSHDNVNGASSVDGYTLSVLERLDNEGILNDSMVVFLSDHGQRYGPLRETTQGWFEEKLPFIYISLPEWFREENPESVEALRMNGRSLTSPFNVYETLRDILGRAGGHVEHGEGCPKCQSLFSPGDTERSCEDVGVIRHWCACTTFQSGNISGELALRGARKIVEQIDDLAKQYVDSKGKRICAKVKVKKIITVQELAGSAAEDGKEFMCQVQVTPGDGKFEATVRSSKDGNFTIVDGEINRLNTYSVTGKCLKNGMKQYCFCE